MTDTTKPKNASNDDNLTKKQANSSKATIPFELFAPTIEGAAIIGNFSNWNDLPMKKDEHGYWRTTLDLADGDYYYKFRVRSKSWFNQPNEWKTITDPKATQIDTKNGDNGVLRIRHGKVSVDEYVWQNDMSQLPANNELIIYELHVADFSGGEDDPYKRGKFKHVTEKLNYLADLGINCLELLPIKEYPGDYSWGYTPQYLFAAESSYGPVEDLKALVDTAHKFGMRVIFDGVYNHASTETPLAQIDHDYWFHHEPRDKSQAWGPQYNYELYDEKYQVMPARMFIKENIEYWVKNFHVDGIRYDAAGQIANFDALKMMAETGRNSRPGSAFINIAECMPEKPDMIGTIDSGRPMDSGWHEAFFWGFANDVITEGKINMEKVKDAIHPMRTGYTDNTQCVNYISNHDHLRLMPHLAKSLVFDEAAFARAKLAATVLMTAVGIPMIWMGEEFADYHGKSMDQQKIDWSLLKNEHNQKLHDHYKHMIACRKQNNALRRNDLEFIFENVEDGIFAFTRWDDGGNRVVVILNLHGTDHPAYTIPNLPDNGKWHDWIYNVDFEIQNSTWSGPIGAWEAKVFVDR